MFNRDLDVCKSCGYKVGEYNLDSKGLCDDCRKEECDECGKAFYLDELNRGICSNCEYKLDIERERERNQMERDYWSSQF